MPCGNCGMMGHNKRTCPKSKPVETPTIPKEVEECPICYEEIGSRNFCVTSCGHKFCMGCIPKHLANSNACPMCRADIVDEPISTGPPAHGPGSIEQVGEHSYNFGYEDGHSQGLQDGMTNVQSQVSHYRRRSHHWLRNFNLLREENRRLEGLLTDNGIDYIQEVTSDDLESEITSASESDNGIDYIQ